MFLKYFKLLISKYLIQTKIITINIQITIKYCGKSKDKFYYKLSEIFYYFKFKCCFFYFIFYKLFYLRIYFRGKFS